MVAPRVLLPRMVLGSRVKGSTALVHLQHWQHCRLVSLMAKQLLLAVLLLPSAVHVLLQAWPEAPLTEGLASCLESSAVRRCKHVHAMGGHDSHV